MRLLWCHIGHLLKKIIWNIKTWGYDLCSVSWDSLSSCFELKTYIFFDFFENTNYQNKKNRNIWDLNFIEKKSLNLILWFNLANFLKCGLQFHLNVYLNIYVWFKCYIVTSYNVDFK